MKEKYMFQWKLKCLIEVTFERFTVLFSATMLFRIIISLTSCWWPLTFAIVDDILLFTVTHAKCLGIMALFFYTCLSVRWT